MVNISVAACFFLLTPLLSIEASKNPSANERSIGVSNINDEKLPGDSIVHEKIPQVRRKRIAIIGAGVSGLAAAKAFSERGHDVVGFERSDTIGGVWDLNRSYPGVKTQSPKDLYRYTDLAMPKEYPEWPSGQQVLSYLSSYAVKYNLLQYFRFSTTVTGINKRADGESGWLVLVQNEKKEKERISFDFVVICSGILTDPKRISYPGEKNFIEAGGRIKHSSEVKGDLSDIEGKHVVIVGGGKSATDIAVYAAANKAHQVTLLIRQNIWRIPYKILGINHKHAYMRAQEILFRSWKETSLSPLNKILSLLAIILIYAYFWLVEIVLTLSLGLKKWDMLPKDRMKDCVSCGTPIMTEGMTKCFQDGGIKPMNAFMESYNVQATDINNHMCVVLNSGELIKADTVIQATGWKMGLPFLSEEHTHKLIDSDGLYRLYRFAVNPWLPNMGFVGFNSSACSVLSSEMIANWLVRYADGMLDSQKTPTETDAEIERLLHWKRSVRPAAMIYGGNCIAPFHYLHFDEILDDIGATLRNKSIFHYPDAAKYGRCLRSAPDYSVS